MTHKVDMNHLHYVPITTADGSLTFLNNENHLHFRSLRGARGESEYVFYKSSALETQPSPWRVLELGLGTGLNFLTTARHAVLEGKSLEYHVVEQEPLPVEHLQALLHREHFLETLCELLEQGIQQAGTGVRYRYENLRTGEISLTVYPSRWQDIALPDDLRVHAVYHDPFGPKDNPDCWTQECFQWSGQHLMSEGRLVTYAANTPLRRAMVDAGLYIGNLPGAHNKREMTVAAPTLSALEGVEILRKKTYYINALERRP